MSPFENWKSKSEGNKKIWTRARRDKTKQVEVRWCYWHKTWTCLATLNPLCRCLKPVQEVHTFETQRAAKTFGTKWLSY